MIDGLNNAHLGTDSIYSFHVHFDFLENKSEEWDKGKVMLTLSWRAFVACIQNRVNELLVFLKNAFIPQTVQFHFLGNMSSSGKISRP